MEELNITEEQKRAMFIRNTMTSLPNSGKLVYESYKRGLSPEENKMELTRHLEIILSFCHTIELYGKDRNEAYKKDMDVVEGIEKIYSQEEINNLVKLTRSYRIIFEKINKCQGINDLEYLTLTEAGKFFEGIRKTAAEKIPIVKIEKKKDHKPKVGNIPAREYIK